MNATEWMAAYAAELRAQQGYRRQAWGAVELERQRERERRKDSAYRERRRAQNRRAENASVARDVGAGEAREQNAGPVA